MRLSTMKSYWRLSTPCPQQIDGDHPVDVDVDIAVAVDDDNDPGRVKREVLEWQ